MSAARARELLPSILLTLLSVVQALALESLWSGVHEMPFLYEGGATAWLGWLQVVAIFQGIIVIWLFYIGIVMRFSWVPGTWDSVAPFALGAGELTLITLMERQQVSLWFVVLAGIFALSTWTSNRMFLAGAADAARTGQRVASAQRGLDRYASYAFGVLLLVMGGSTWLVGGDGALAITCLVGANLLLLAQGALIQHYWRTWVGGEGEARGDD